MSLSQVSRASCCLLVAAGTACAQNQNARQEPAKSATKQKAASDVLVFCDRTPGAFFWADTWQDLAERKGEKLTFTTTVEEFTAQLTAGSWSRVMVLARWAPGTPAYAAALRQYAEAHPRQRIEMYLWHDHGTQPEANTAVLASTARATWLLHRSMIGYLLVSGDDPKADEARVVAGLVFPDFRYQDADLRTEPPVVVGLISEPPGGGGPRIAGMAAVGPCELECWTIYLERRDGCYTQYQGDYAQCDELYGSDPECVEEWTACVLDAGGVLDGCLSGAMKAYKRCVALCKKIATSTTRPVEAQPVPR